MIHGTIPRRASCVVQSLDFSGWSCLPLFVSIDSDAGCDIQSKLPMLPGCWAHAIIILTRPSMLRECREVGRGHLSRQRRCNAFAAWLCKLAKIPHVQGKCMMTGRHRPSTAEGKKTHYRFVTSFFQLLDTHSDVNPEKVLLFACAEAVSLPRGHLFALRRGHEHFRVQVLPLLTSSNFAVIRSKSSRAIMFGNHSSSMDHEVNYVYRLYGARERPIVPSRSPHSFYPHEVFSHKGTTILLILKNCHIRLVKKPSIVMT